jgi:hypothetical protein
LAVDVEALSSLVAAAVPAASSAAPSFEEELVMLSPLIHPERAMRLSNARPATAVSAHAGLKFRCIANELNFWVAD